LEPLVAITVVLPATLAIAAVGGLLLSRSRQLALRVAAMVLAVVAFGLGVLLATRVDSLGALTLGWGGAAAGVIAAVRTLRLRLSGPSGQRLS
jgi:hypothetical protein